MGGWQMFEDGFGPKRSMSVFFCRIFFNVFPFPFIKVEFIGDWHDNKRGRREIITVRGQSYVLHLPKHWPPHPPLRPASVLRGEDTLARGRGGWRFNILEDSRVKTQLCTLPISNPLWARRNELFGLLQLFKLFLFGPPIGDVKILNFPC